MSSEETPDLLDVLDLFGENLLNNLHTALPGRVESYDPATQRADVQPLIRRRIPKAGTDRREWVYEDLPLIPSVRVIHPRGGGAFVHLPIATGDTVLLVFCETGIGHWEAGNGDMSDAGDERRHHLAHAVAIPGFYPASRNIEDLGPDNKTHLIVGFNGGARLSIKPNGDVQVDTSGTITLAGAGAAQFMARADRVDAAISELRSSFTSHVHPTAAMGPASTPLVSGLSPVFTAGGSAADQVKGK